MDPRISLDTTRAGYGCRIDAACPFVATQQSRASPGHSGPGSASRAYLSGFGQLAERLAIACGRRASVAMSGRFFAG